MGLLKTTTGTLTSTGTVTKYTSISDIPTKMYVSVVGKDGGTSVASGCIGFAAESAEKVSSFGRKGANSSTEERTDRCIHFFKVNSDGSKTTLLSASFEEFTEDLWSLGLIGLKFDVSVANSDYDYIARLED